MDEIIISVFYDIDSFCMELKKFFEHYIIPCNGKAQSFEPPSALSLSEIMTICVCFTCLATGHLNGMTQNLSKSNTASSFLSLSVYNRFVELMSYATDVIYALHKLQVSLHGHKLCGFYNTGCV